MHIAPSGSPQPTKQAFICKLYSGFPCIFSQQKPHRCICIPQGARNAVLRETQPETSAHFSVMFFRKTRKISADVQAYFKRNLTPYCGNSARNLKSFFGDVFSQDKASKPPLYMHTARRKKRSFTGESQPEPQIIFRRCFFRKTRKISDGVLSVLRAKFDTVFGKLSPNLKSFFGDVFSQNKENKRRRTSVLQAKFDAIFGKAGQNIKSFFGDVFSQDKENKRRRTSVLQAKFDTVLRKNSPKNQISIMSASFFFAISSISLTYLSVIF